MDFSKLNFGVDGDSITAGKQWSWHVFNNLGMTSHHNVAVGSAVWYKRTITCNNQTVTTQSYNDPNFAGISGGWEPTDDISELQKRANNCAIVHVENFISDVKKGIAPIPDIFAFHAFYSVDVAADATREEIKTCSYRVFENTLALKCASYTQMRTFIGNEGYNILTDVNEDDITLTFKELPAAIIDALIGKYGKNNPFLVGIPVFGRVSTSYGTFSTETANPILIARGNMFGIIVSTTIDSVEYNYLKLIPYCTECEVYQSVLVSMPPDTSDYIRQIYKKGMNTNGKYGTDWILDSMGIPTDSAVDNAYRPNWLAVISPFCIEIPLY